MRNLTPPLSVLLCLLFCSPLAQAEIYKWVDENGNIQFGDKPSGATTKVESVKLQPLNSYSAPKVTPEQARMYSGDSSVVMYSTAWCGYCKKAREYFKAKGISFSEYDVETSTKGKRFYRRQARKGVPIILVGDRRMNGFSVEGFERIYR